MKRRVELTHPAGTPVHAATLAGIGGLPNVKTTAEKPGTVGWLDKAKRFYKAAIAVVGALMVALNELTPIFGEAQWITVAIGVVTSISVFLKSNEHWVDVL